MKTYAYDAVVIGTGAAGYNAASRIKEAGNKSVAMVTEGIYHGTSRNTGSDKQTYYKLGIAGSVSDSVRKMANDLFAGGSVDGDNALCEAVLSLRCFLHLCELGVEFPTNRYGEYVGYKTDHDPYARATSAGPLTSKHMTQSLQRYAEKLGVEVFDGYLAIEILKVDAAVCGLLCMEANTGELVAFQCSDIVMATGGPAGIYADSVYPVCHTGTSSLALRAGARMQNLTEWQYGLASVEPRWNVSGTYMQVLPVFVSVDENGTEHEFLGEYFEDIYEALSMVFLKGYQWPFDSKKVLTGSSVIDILVYQECVIKNRKVYLDYTRNPFYLENIDYSKLSEEAYAYLSNAGACFGKPINRLLKMNAPAVALYLGKGVDLTKERLQISLCAQHNNGGIAVDMWWRTSVRGLYAVGECAGTHGVSRPGGSALNAGQVGSLRAAQYISECGNPRCSDEDFQSVLLEAAARHKKMLSVLRNGTQSIRQRLLNAQSRMSNYAAAIRNKENMERALEEVKEDARRLPEEAFAEDPAGYCMYYKLKDVLEMQQAVLSAMIHYADTVGATRGSALYTDPAGSLRNGLSDIFRFTQEDGTSHTKVQDLILNGDAMVVSWRDVRPIPPEDGIFENIWRSYRENKNVY